MANTVEKYIKETSDRINHVRNIVRTRVDELSLFPLIVPSNISHNIIWKDKQFTHPEWTVRVATMFSGIGAVEHAFQRLRLKHKIVFAGDIDDKCKQSYFANYQINPNDWFDDARKFDATKYKGQVDLLVGGAPCQAFSMVGRRLGFEDARGTLFYEFARVIKETQPKVFIFENVKGLISHDKGRTWQVIYDIFKELGYQVYYRVLNSKDYGIPQHRERLFCIGFKNPTTFEYPAPIPLEYRMYDFLEDFVDTKNFLREKGVKFVTSHKNHIKCYTQINGDIALCQKRNQQFNWHGDFVYHPLTLEEELEEVKKQKERYETSADDIETRIDKATEFGRKTERDRLTIQLNNKDKQITALSQEKEELLQKLHEKEKELKEVKRQLHQIKASEKGKGR